MANKHHGKDEPRITVDSALCIPRILEPALIQVLCHDNFQLPGGYPHGVGELAAKDMARNQVMTAAGIGESFTKFSALSWEKVSRPIPI